ncbi:MAG TPA: MBL fold metallo-hydrolase [Acidobacteriota bacterium]|nr:MBL fold metallo-hydrolase [Acidobacteriota bacterium]
MKLFDDFYVYLWQGSDNNCNTSLFANVFPGGKHLLVDPGHIITPSFREPALETLARDMQRDGIELSSTGLVALTHGHPDHVEAAVLLQQQLKVPVAMHQADEEMFRMMGGKIDVYLQDGTLEPGSDAVCIQVLHSPGHSPGHVTFYRPDRKALVAGDCVFYRSMGRTDFPGGSARQLQQSIQRMSQLDIEYVVCGHPYGHSGLLQGSEEVRQNFEFILRYF